MREEVALKINLPESRVQVIPSQNYQHPSTLLICFSFKFVKVVIALSIIVSFEINDPIEVIYP